MVLHHFCCKTFKKMVQRSCIGDLRGVSILVIILPHQEGLAGIFGVPERYIDSITFKTLGESIFFEAG